MYEYYLVALISHIGSIEGGHYVAYIKHNDKWYKCDDSFICEVEEEDVKNAQAYMLYYAKCEEQ